MDNEKVSEPALTKSKIYLANVMLGNTKEKSKVLAGYSKDNAMVEKSKAYAVALQSILATNTESLEKIAENIKERIDGGELDKISVKDVAFLGKTLSDIHKTMTPQVTVKEETMKDGTLKRTTWGTASYQTSQNDTGQEGKIEDEE